MMSNETVKTLRDHYLAENSFGVESYRVKGFPVFVGKWTVFLPNPGQLKFHDLHHVVTGYGTGLVGEAEISAYELRGGCHSLLIFIFCAGAIFFAMFVSPKRVRAAWKQAKGTRTLYDYGIPYSELLEMEVGDLRRRLGIPPKGMRREL
jgi:hypothetical protein